MKLWYGTSPISLIFSLLFKDLSLLFISFNLPFVAIITDIFVALVIFSFVSWGFVCL